DQEMKKLFRKRYRFKCSTVRETLPYIECDKCKFRFKGGVLGVGNILVKNIRKLSGLTNTERGIACLLGTVFDNFHNYFIPLFIFYFIALHKSKLTLYKIPSQDQEKE
ncbi:unnamed protein product, partial [marine sediment metagenome]